MVGHEKLRKIRVCVVRKLLQVPEQGQNKIHAGTLGHGKLEKVMEEVMESHGI